MTITKDLSITRKVSSGAYVVISGSLNMVIDSTMDTYAEVDAFYKSFSNKNAAARDFLVTSGEVKIPACLMPENKEAPVKETPAAPATISPKDLLLRGLANMINFFSEFAFTPSFRFVNTLAHNYRTPQTAAAFISRYFELMDSTYTNDVTEKMKSKEFKDIITDIMQYAEPTNIVNSRLKVYYGPAGTGKTTIAQQETNNRCIVCNASMLPSDLMEDFTFDSGSPTFNPSVLCECMEKGLPIVLDEINLLPFDSLRFLQGITDGKTSIIYKNRTINIHDGFQIIGTMNLSLGGATYGLPEPLVDRCSEIKSFTLTADQLAAAIM